MAGAEQISGRAVEDLRQCLFQLFEINAVSDKGLLSDLIPDRERRHIRDLLEGEPIRTFKRSAETVFQDQISTGRILAVLALGFGEYRHFMLTHPELAKGIRGITVNMMCTGDVGAYILASDELMRTFHDMSVKRSDAVPMIDKRRAIALILGQITAYFIWEQMNLIFNILYE